MSVIDQTKRLLAEDRYRIRLHDHVAAQVKEAMGQTTANEFPVAGSWSPEEFRERVTKYEAAMSDLLAMQILLAYWGTVVHGDTLVLAPKRLSGHLGPESGLTAWIALRWYPVLLLLYAGGTAAVAADRYTNLRALLHARVPAPHSATRSVSLVRGVVAGLSDIDESFKLLPGHERHHTPRSEYLFKRLRTTFDDLLFLGSDYEASFDRFEVLFALEHASEYASERSGRAWGPVGRFGWKFSRDESGPFQSLVAEAEAQADSWPPIKAGLFKGSAQRFQEVSVQYRSMLSGLHWW